jgi:hypothetical protein
MRRRRHRRVGAGLGSGLLFLVTLHGCRGEPESSERAVAVRRGEDVVASGRTVAVGQSVPGDVVVAGGDIRFSGRAGGDYLGAASEQLILGQVDGSVRAAGGEIVLAGEVGRNATLAGGRVQIDVPGEVQGNAYLAGGEIAVRGSIGEFLQVAGGEVLLDGPVGGDVDVRAGRLHLGPNARITGGLTYSVRNNNVTMDPAARIAGEVVALAPPRMGWLTTLRIALHAGFLLAGAALVLLFPWGVTSAGRLLRRRPLASAGWGLLWVVAVPLIAALLGATVIGLPLAAITAALYMIALYLGRAVLAIWLGERILRRDPVAVPGRGAAVANFLVGGVLLVVLGLLPIIGGLIVLLSTLVGLGAATLMLNARSRLGKPTAEAERRDPMAA